MDTFSLDCIEWGHTLKSLKDLKNFFNGTADSAQLSELRAQLKTLIYPVDTQRLLPKPGPSTAKDTSTTPKRTTTDKPPTPPMRPAHTKVEIPLEDISSSKSLEYAVKKLGDKGLDVKGYRAFLQRHLHTRSSTHKWKVFKFKLALLESSLDTYYLMMIP